MFSKYYKAAIAFVGIVGTTLGSVAADPDVAGVLPSGWGAAVAAAGVTVTTWLVWLKKNEPTVAEAEQVLREARERL